jgi:hypothetical protein
MLKPTSTSLDMIGQLYEAARDMNQACTIPCRIA